VPVLESRPAVDKLIALKDAERKVAGVFSGQLTYEPQEVHEHKIKFLEDKKSDPILCSDKVIQSDNLSTGPSAGFNFLEKVEKKIEEIEDFSSNAKPPGLSFGLDEKLTSGNKVDQPVLSFSAKENEAKSSFSLSNKITQSKIPASLSLNGEKNPEENKPLMSLGSTKEEKKDITTPAFNFGSKQEQKTAEVPALNFGAPRTTGTSSVPPSGFAVEKKDDIPAFNLVSTTKKNDENTPFKFGSLTDDKTNKKPPFSFGAATGPSQDTSSATSLSGEKKDADSSLFGNKESVSSFNVGSTSKPEEKKAVPSFNFDSKPDEYKTGAPSFSFGTKLEENKENKPSTFSFGSRPEKPTSQFLFGSKPEEKNATSSFTFGSTAEKKEPSGESKAPKPFVFGAPSEKKESTPTFAFGSTTEKKESAASLGFGSTTEKKETTPFSFGSTAEKKETSPFSFGTTTEKKQTTPTFSFGSAVEKKDAVSVFGAGSTNDDKKEPTPFLFGSQAQNKKEPSPFSTGSAPSKEAASSSQFNFGGNTSAFGSKPANKRSAFDASNDDSAVQSSTPIFSKTSAQPAATTMGFGAPATSSAFNFGAATSKPTPFGQHDAAKPATANPVSFDFGKNSQTQNPTSVFGEQPQNPSSVFGQQTNAPPASGSAFQFGSNATVPGFGSGSNTPAFGGTPQPQVPQFNNQSNVNFNFSGPADPSSVFGGVNAGNSFATSTPAMTSTPTPRVAGRKIAQMRQRRR
jgi:hypothetical protein